MFERYNESARRALFFARYESSELGAVTIETEHLLLGLVRERKGVTGRLLETAQVTLERAHADVERRAPVRPKVSTSIEMPFSAEVKRVLEAAAAEADALHHSYIGTEHLLLGMLREEQSVAGSLLIGYGLHLGAARKAVAELVGEAHGGEWVASTVDPAGLIDRIGQLAGSLANAAPGSEDAATLLTQVHMLLGQLRGCFGR